MELSFLLPLVARTLYFRLDLIQYAYPEGLKTGAEMKKASSSFSSVLINQTKRGILERTVPGKYMWAKKKL